MITKDTAFFQAVADQVRRVSARPRQLRKMPRIEDLPPAVGLQDLVLVDARSCRGLISRVLKLPCGKIILDGLAEASLRELRLTLARSCSDRQARSRAGPELPVVETVHLATDPNPAQAAAATPADNREQTLLSLACQLATLKPEKINKACQECLPGLVGARRASGYLYNPAKSWLELAWHTPDEPVAESVAISPFRTDCPLAVAANRRSTWYAEDVDEGLTALGIAVPRPHAGRYDSKACIVAPIIFGAELLGAVCFADPLEGQAFDRRELEPLVEGLTYLLAATWQNVNSVGSLEQMARTDGLTGLANYRAFEETITREVTRARRYSQPLSLILMDVDNLKQVNDRFGHQAGDLLLREVARRLAGALRETDMPARQGGDEFSVILPNTSLSAARQVVTRIEEAVNGARVHWLKHIFESTVSIALGQYDGQSSVSAFFAEVDARLYGSKPCSHLPA